MQGTLIKVSPDAITEEIPLDHEPTAAELHEHIGGYIELVPCFDHYLTRSSGTLRSKWVACLAFCDEEHKLKGLPINIAASSLWYAALDHQWTPEGAASLIPHYRDYLGGTVLIIIGDEVLDAMRNDEKHAFMEEVQLEEESHG